MTEPNKRRVHNSSTHLLQWPTCCGRGPLTKPRYLAIISTLPNLVAAWVNGRETTINTTNKCEVVIFTMARAAILEGQRLLLTDYAVVKCSGSESQKSMSGHGGVINGREHPVFGQLFILETCLVQHTPWIVWLTLCIPVPSVKYWCWQTWHSYHKILWMKLSMHVGQDSNTSSVVHLDYDMMTSAIPTPHIGRTVRGLENATHE